MINLYTASLFRTVNTVKTAFKAEENDATPPKGDVKTDIIEINSALAPDELVSKLESTTKTVELLKDPRKRRKEIVLKSQSSPEGQEKPKSMTLDKAADEVKSLWYTLICLEADKAGNPHPPANSVEKPEADSKVLDAELDKIETRRAALAKRKSPYKYR